MLEVALGIAIPVAGLLGFFAGRRTLRGSALRAYTARRRQRRELEAAREELRATREQLARLEARR